ncbi:hypothetical protein [Pseudomonas guariconensis]|uniref:hypothetical protein n=1 Tax=Pseudomonas guariconensis TaxID=1288410 RepID=UPI003905EA55
MAALSLTAPERSTMNPAFQEALAARLLWVDVAAMDSVEEFADQTGPVLQAAFDAVHRLAANDVLTYRHYGAEAPRMLQDVPLLAAQYTLAHQVYTELYVTNFEQGKAGALSEAWMNPSTRQAFSQWVAEATLAMEVEIAEGEYEMTVSDPMRGQEAAMLQSWSEGDSATDAAVMLYWVYEMELDEKYRRHCEDIAETYASIEAELWAGWREDCEQDHDLAA